MACGDNNMHASSLLEKKIQDKSICVWQTAALVNTHSVDNTGRLSMPYIVADKIFSNKCNVIQQGTISRAAAYSKHDVDTE